MAWLGTLLGLLKIQELDDERDLKHFWEFQGRECLGQFTESVNQIFE